MKGSFLFLGTGASSGVPMIGCHCAVCSSIDVRNKRLRPSGLVRIGETVLLIDVGPDFRAQALAYKIDRVDGLLLTHTHYDHIGGIDDLRVLNFRQKQPIPCLLSQESLDELKIRYHYLFKKSERDSSHSAEIKCQVLDGDAGSIRFVGVDIDYASYSQGGMKVNGFRIGRFAYVSDIRHYGDEIFSFLDGVDTLVLSALRGEPSVFHFSLDEAAAFAEKAKVRQTWLTHMSHAVEHTAALKSLPAHVQPGCDGLELFFEI